MRTRRRYWLSKSNEEREVATSAMTLDCPFCSAPLTSAATAVLELSRRCECRAMVIRRGKPERISPPPGAMAAAYHEITQRLKQTIVGHDDVV